MRLSKFTFVGHDCAYTSPCWLTIPPTPFPTTDAPNTTKHCIHLGYSEGLLLLFVLAFFVKVHPRVVINEVD
jgi:hypothetical protein